MRRLILSTVFGLTCATGGAVAIWAPHPDWPVVVERARQLALDTSAAGGLRLEALTVEGRVNTAPADLLAALDTERGAPILAIDVVKGRAAVAALPWVKTAKVERRLPDTVHIVITERTPFALWQQDNRYTLVDREGKAIVDVPDTDGSLPLIVGADAPRHAPALFEALSAAPELAARVRAAVRIGGRRWNLHLDATENGVVVELPEGDIAAAWSRLAALENGYRILERDIDTIDLRLADYLTVRPHKDPVTEAVAPQQPKKPTAGVKQTVAGRT